MKTKKTKRTPPATTPRIKWVLDSDGCEAVYVGGRLAESFENAFFGDVAQFANARGRLIVEFVHVETARPGGEWPAGFDDLEPYVV